MGCKEKWETLTRDEIESALNIEFSFAKRVIQKYPYSTVLSLCRLIYSFENRAEKTTQSVEDANPIRPESLSQEAKARGLKNVKEEC